MKYLLTLLIAGLAVAAAVTNPDEAQHKKAVMTLHGPLFSLGAVVGEVTGATRFQYHNYGVFSQETIKDPDGKTYVLSTGAFGRVWVSEPK